MPKTINGSTDDDTNEKFTTTHQLSSDLCMRVPNNAIINKIGNMTYNKKNLNIFILILFLCLFILLLL